jgi:hypothetical protein
LALIAGLLHALTWWEDLGKAIKVHAAELLERPEELKLLICAYHGHPNDAMRRGRPAGGAEAERRPSELELIWTPSAQRR